MKPPSPTHAPNGKGRPLCGERSKSAKVDFKGQHTCPACIARLADAEREAEGFSLRHFEIRDQARLDETESDYTAPEPVVALVDYWLRILAPELRRQRGARILDPSAGAGIFGQVLERFLPLAERTGVELREEERRHVEANYTVASIADFEVWAAELIQARRHYEERQPKRAPWYGCADVDPDPRALRFDAIVTNPPFSRAFRRDFDKETGEIVRRAWIEVCHELLVPGGWLVFIGLTQWGQTKEAADLMKAYPPAHAYRFGGRLSFEEHGRTDSREYSGWFWKNTYDQPLERRIECASEPTWTTANGKQLAVRKWKAGSIPGTYPLPFELFAPFQAGEQTT